MLECFLQFFLPFLLTLLLLASIRFYTWPETWQVQLGVIFELRPLVGGPDFECCKQGIFFNLSGGEIAPSFHAWFVLMELMSKCKKRLAIS